VEVRRHQPLELRRALFDWHRTYVMGVVNVTPDSFSDGGRYAAAEEAIAQGRALIKAGADVIDVGGESTRPGAPRVETQAELERVVPVVRALSGRVAVSIDTYKAPVADAALQAGAEIVNDVSGGQLDRDLLSVVARHGAAVILGHMRGTPGDMNERATYHDVVREVRAELEERVARAVEAGVQRERILVDPGLGFSKKAEHTLALLARLDEIVALGFPVVIGASRKSFLGHVTGKPVDDREIGTAAASAIAVMRGAVIVRVHDVAAQLDAVRVADAIRGARP
jgi:dihydropteroate synthase